MHSIFFLLGILVPSVLVILGYYEAALVCTLVVVIAGLFNEYRDKTDLIEKSKEK
jgi:uncharacterized membrane protein